MYMVDEKEHITQRLVERERENISSLDLFTKESLLGKEIANQ